MARRSYSTEQKSAAIEAVLQGQEISFVAQEFDIPHQTLRSWMRRAQITMHKVAPTPTNIDKIGGLLVRLVEAELEGMEAIARMIQDDKWLKGQRADNIAALYALMSDKNMQKIEAMSGVPDDNTP